MYMKRGSHDQHLQAGALVHALRGDLERVLVAREDVAEGLRVAVDPVATVRDLEKNATQMVRMQPRLGDIVAYSGKKED